MRVFINNCDGYVGNALCADLRRINGDSNILFGTLIGGAGVQVPTCVRRVVSRTDVQELLKTITSCTTIIFDMHEQDLEELEYVLKALKIAKFEKPTTFVLISSVNVWSKSKALYETITPEDAEEGAEPIMNPIPFKDSDFRKRIPGPKYMEWKTMETLVMALNSKENLRSFVISAGVLYGNGEQTFHNLFKASWQSKTDELRILGGENVIPTVHVRDLARLVKTVISDPSVVEQEYIVAVDRGNKTQAEIVEGILATVSDRTEPVPIATPGETLLAEDIEVMTLDLRIEPSSILDTIRWWCEDGLVGDNLAMVAQEFCQWRKLAPIKILAQAPPGAGLTKLLAEMASYYKIPIIDVDKEVEVWMEENKPPEEEEEGAGDPEAAEKYQTIQTAWNEAKEKKEHLDDALLAPIVTKRLESNVCSFRGYILNRYPTTFQNAEQLFQQVESVEGEEEEAEKKTLKMKILPSYIMFLKSEEEKCKERALESQEISEDDFKKITAKYYQDNEPEDGSPTVFSFFQETCTSQGQERKVLTVNVDEFEATENVTPKAFEVFRKYLEEVFGGPPFNYLARIGKTEEQIAQEIEVAEAKKVDEEKRTGEEEQAILLQQQQEQTERNQEMEKKLLGQEKQLLEQYSLPLRQYMATYVIPTLTEGLLEVCKVMPEDPVDYLAEYLFAHAQEVPGAPEV